MNMNFSNKKNKYNKLKYDPKNSNGWSYYQYYYYTVTLPNRRKKINEKNLFKYGGVPYLERKLNMARIYAKKNRELLKQKYHEKMKIIKANPLLLLELRKKQKIYSTNAYSKNKEKIKDRSRKYYWRVKKIYNDKAL
jgi:hypothetical protein